MVVRSLLTDTPVDVLAGFDADVVADAPTALGTTLVSLVPTALDRLDRHFLKDNTLLGYWRSKWWPRKGD